MTEIIFYRPGIRNVNTEFMLQITFFQILKQKLNTSIMTSMIIIVYYLVTLLIIIFICYYYSIMSYHII